MDLAGQIRQHNNQQEFVRLCNSIFTDIHKTDFQIIDGTQSDEGNDGYVISEERLLAIYCPSKPETRTAKDYQDKINKDLEKAQILNQSQKVKIKEWVFVTPSPLKNTV